MLFINQKPPIITKKSILSSPREILYGDGSYSLMHHESMRKFDYMFGEPTYDNFHHRYEPYLCPICSIVRNQIVPNVRFLYEHGKHSVTQA